MRVLVTGGSGFIGTNLIRDLLEVGHDVKSLDIRESITYPSVTTLGDIRNQDDVIRVSKGVDVIVHLAAEHRDDIRPIRLYYEVNVDGAKRIVEGAARNDVRAIVFTSTVAVYGLNAGISDETSERRPFNDYGRSKAAAEEVFLCWAKENTNRCLVVIRPCVVFGEGNRGNVHTLLKQIASGRFLRIGNGDNRKSMAYVRNVSRFILRCLDFETGTHVINYADKPDLTTNEIVRIVCRRMGRKPPPRIPYSIGLAGGMVLDLVGRATGRAFPISAVRVRKFCSDTTISTKRLDHTGWTSLYTLEEGLERMIASEFGDRNILL